MEFFDKRKQDILEKKDKSFRGNWDKKIMGLCRELNKSKKYYTTSSCSGRIVLILDSNKKTYGLFLKIYHNLINLKEFDKTLEKILNKVEDRRVNFKQEPCGLHVACRTLQDAQILTDKARKVGWKKSGIISSNKRTIVEMFGAGNLGFPIIRKRKILVDNDFLKEIVEASNENLRKSWKCINALKAII